VGFYEGAQEILAGADYHRHAVTGRPDRVGSGFGGGAVYLYSLLAIISHSAIPQEENECIKKNTILLFKILISSVTQSARDSLIVSNRL